MYSKILCYEYILKKYLLFDNNIWKMGMKDDIWIYIVFCFLIIGCS